MKTNNRKNIASIAKTFIAAIASLVIWGCGSNPTGAADRDAADDRNGVVQSDLVLGKVGALRKQAAIDLRKVHFTLVSSAADTVRDSASVSGREQVVVSRTWSLKPLRTWIIHARSVDAKDSVIHLGQSAAFFVKPADTVNVNMSLASRFSMYEATFSALPDSISSSVSGTGKDKLNINRVTLKIDGAVKGDSAKASGYFAAGQNVTVLFDYMAPGSHQVVLEASGKLNDFEGVLYRGTADFNVAAGVDETRTVTLAWVGPTTGSGKLTVTLGRTGKVTVNGSLPGTVL